MGILILLAACTPSQAAPPGPLLASVAVGSRAGTPTVGLGAVWIPNTGDGTVSKIDPSTNRTVATLRVGDARAFYQKVCRPYGSVHSWMVTTFHVRRCDLPSAVAIDVHNDHPSAAVSERVGDRLADVAPGPGNNGHSILKIHR